MDKTKFLADLAAAATKIKELTKDLQGLDWQYWKYNYATGNGNQITDAQASAIGATAADVTAAITAIEAIQAVLITQSQITAFYKIAS
jgi:hypothetical protein